MTAMEKITNFEDYHDAIQDGKVAVFFNASWCDPCRLVRPIYDELSLTRGDIRFLDIDADALDQAVLSPGDQQPAVSALPRLLMFKDGKYMGTIKGANSRSKVEELLARLD